MKKSIYLVFILTTCLLSKSLFSQANYPQMHVVIKTRTFQVELEANATVDALKSLLPMKLQMEDLNANEKFCYLNKALPTSSVHPQKIHAGDIMLYGNNCIVIFYKTFTTSYAYTKIGRVKNLEGLEGILGKGDVDVEFIDRM